MHSSKFHLITAALLLFFASTATAQYPVVSAQDVRTWMTGKKKALLVDVRSPEEYQAGHISGAINIPAERIRGEAGLLPKDKTKPIIFYCRGAG